MFYLLSASSVSQVVPFTEMEKSRYKADRGQEDINNKVKMREVEFQLCLEPPGGT